ncbi:MAG TPA: sulfotransferase [Rhodothermales bacterium]|nr:sulfotransferase [Rhodothermales bacterium]
MNIIYKTYHRYRLAYRDKVFGVGYLKTGTTSLRRAFEQLGYKHCGWSKARPVQGGDSTC